LAHKIEASGFNLTPIVTFAGSVIVASNIGQMRGALAFSHNGKNLRLLQ
jgi:hypothetical protein